MSALKPYPEYKDSGVEWLSKVPTGWEVRRIKSVGSLVTAKATDRVFPVALENVEGWSGRFLESESDLAGEGVGFIRGDILFGKLRPYLAKVWLADRTGEAVGDFHVVRAGRSADSRFLQYCMLTVPFISLVDGSTYGAKMPRAGWDFIGNIEWSFPSLAEQRIIARYLDRETAEIDAFIADQEELVALLNERRTATITHAVTKGLDLTVQMKDSGVPWMGKVPEHWTKGRITRFAEMKTGHTPSRSTPEYWVDCVIPWFTLADVWQLRRGARHLGETRQKISRLGLANSAAELLPAGTVVLSRTASVGFSGIMPIPMATSQDYWNWVCGPKLMPEYLWYQFSAMTPHFASVTQGSTHKTIYQADAASLQVAVPPMEEQESVVAHLDHETVEIEAAIADAKEAIGLSKERRAALISAAVTGKIDVRNHITAELGAA